MPEEVRGVRARKIAEGEAERLRGAASLGETDVLEKRARREAIHAREGGHCFYCRRRVTAAARCIDHIIPRVRMGRIGYRREACLQAGRMKCRGNCSTNDRNAEVIGIPRQKKIEPGHSAEGPRDPGLSCPPPQ